MSDKRLVFKIQDYNIICARPSGCPGVAGGCGTRGRECGGEHTPVSHGGRPVAASMFSSVWEHDSVIARIATPDAVPDEIRWHCPLQWDEPHDHEDIFRWEESTNEDEAKRERLLAIQHAREVSV